jgi:5-deoxy-glucuronate isomerase
MTSHLLVKANYLNRELVNVTPEKAGWAHVGFRAIQLKYQEVETLETGERELCLVVLTGKINLTVSGQNFHQTFNELGTRDSVFEETSPAAIYIPKGFNVSLSAIGNAEVALCTEVEVITPAGHSSSYPPHKHDQELPPTETQLEETYYHRLNPPQGFAFQRVYTDDRSLDEACAVEDHDVVMVPKGYHPVVAPHAYDLYYLNVMAGPQRFWVFKNDPKHEWMLQDK